MQDHVCQGGDREFMQAHVIKRLALSKTREYAEYRAARELVLHAIKEGSEKGFLDISVPVSGASRAIVEAMAGDLDEAGYYVDIWEYVTAHRSSLRLEISWRDAGPASSHIRVVDPDEIT